MEYSLYEFSKISFLVYSGNNIQAKTLTPKESKSSLYEFKWTNFYQSSPNKNIIIKVYLILL